MSFASLPFQNYLSYLPMSQPLTPPQPPEDFQSKEEAIRWMLTVNALNHKKANTKKSDPRRVYFQCTEPGCQFCCHVFKGVDGLFRAVRWTCTHAARS